MDPANLSDSHSQETQEALEETLLAVLDAAESQVAALGAVQAALQAGWLNLVRARYTMGPLRVSQLQWRGGVVPAQAVVDLLPPLPHSSMHAFLGEGPAQADSGRADQEICIEEEIENQGAGSEAGPSFVLRLRRRKLNKSGGSEDRPLGSGESAISDDSADTGIGGTMEAAQPEGLRHRRAWKESEAAEQVQGPKASKRTSFTDDDLSTGKSLGSPSDETESVTESQTPEATLEKCTWELSSVPDDPLRWFGALVPPSLRQAQSDFQRALECTVELANARQQVADAQARYIAILDGAGS